MQSRTASNTAFLIDLALLFAAAPALFFPGFFPSWARWPALALLAAGWLWRRRQLGQWRAPTPADWPLLLFTLMLPVAVWAAPAPLRDQYSLPRALILLWNLSLFAAIAAHTSRSARGVRLSLVLLALIGVAIALVAPFGMNWLYKFRGIRTLIDSIPAPLLGLFSDAESGFHPNQVAGTLLYILPLFLALSVRELRPPAGLPAAPLRAAATLAATVVIAAVLALTQSRAGLLGLAVGCLAMLLLPSYWGRRAMLLLALAFIALLPFFPGSSIDLASDTTGIELLGRTNTLGFRQSIWEQAVAAIRTVPWTGLGLGTYRDLIWILYPIDFAHSREVFHAHNFFLQTALDLGVPGLIALIALYLLAIAQVLHLWARAETAPKNAPKNAPEPSALDLPWRYLALGFAGSLVAQIVSGLLDAVAMGAKTNFVFWYLLALLMGIANLAAQTPAAQTPATQTPEALSP